MTRGEACDGKAAARTSAPIGGIELMTKLVIMLYYHGFYSALKMRGTWMLARSYGCLRAALPTWFGRTQHSMNAVNRPEISVISD